MTIAFNSDLNTAAYSLLSIHHPIFTAEAIIDLHATRDAAELADLLINTIPLDEFPFELDLDRLHMIMTDMILNPID